MNQQADQKTTLDNSQLVNLHQKIDSWREKEKNILTESDLKPRVLDKKVKDPAQKLTRKELNLIVAYFEELKKGTSADLARLSTGAPLFKDLIKDLEKTIDNLIKEYDKQTTPKSSLIPIKGISKVLQARLRELYIYDVAALLSRGRTQAGRNSIAAKLKIDVQLVESWVKQADLWRVSGMTTDIAYLLAIAGVRCVEDLARVDAKKIFPIIKGICSIEIDFRPPSSEGEINSLITNAQDLLIYSIRSDHLRLRSLPKALSKAIKAGGDADRMDMQGIVEFIQRDMLTSLSKVGGGVWYEQLGETPLHLFKNDIKIPEVEYVASGKVIKKGLDFLDEIQYTLPLPNTLSGVVYIRSKDSADKRVFPGVEVEISGIVSPAEDLKDLNKKLAAVTDSQGKFIITLPDKYSIKEVVTISISQGGRRQEFVKNASEILNAVQERKKLEGFYELDALGDEIDNLELLIERTEKEIISLEERKGYNANGGQHAQNIRIQHQIDKLNKLLNDDPASNRPGGYKWKMQELLAKYDEIEGWILKEFNASSVKMAFGKLLAACNSLNANLEGANYNERENDGFVIIEELFRSEPEDLEKTLPKVKLMGNDDHVIRLSTDTAPSKTYSYSMLQRLVEPNVSSQESRKKLTKPVNVTDFKEKIRTSPQDCIRASSLGVGYVLNMHQAWVPDGFALGSLLYSLILAPGEEQRLVVRENKQRYSVINQGAGSDTVREDYLQDQSDDTTAAFNYAVNQMSNAQSNYDYSASTSSWGLGFGIGGFYSGFAGALGLAGGSSKAKGTGSASASQHNFHNEASNAAQSFQRSIKSASNRISQAKRISMSMGSAETSDSVATKIIANHNHSHTMTVQYWEVMRRYKLETCIDSVDLVLFVPLELVKFLPDEQQQQTNTTNKSKGSEFDKTQFDQRYKTLLKYEDVLRYALPRRYRNGLRLIQKYAAYPNWTMENINDSSTKLSLTFYGNFLTFDDLSVTLYLKNGRGSIAGEIEKYERAKIQYFDDGKYRDCSSTNEVLQAIRDARNKRGEVKVTCSFHLPSDLVNDDLDYIRIKHSVEPLNYTLKLHRELEEAETEAKKNLKDYLKYLAEDNIKSDTDRANIEHYKSLLPEAFITPNITLAASRLKSLGNPTIHTIEVKQGDATVERKQGENKVEQEKTRGIHAMLLRNELNNAVSVRLSADNKTLRYSELQLMEETLQHVASETLRYSQVVWQSLSSGERAMLLEPYTIDMNFEEIPGSAATSAATVSKEINIPLLNCVNIMKPLGFYGNCMLLPFTYPLSLAKKLGKTSGEIQDALYRYHTNNFRVPTTVISLPTDGMIGEAVLGETNVSEEIDLTRFWNWQDSPIDKMEINNKYLNSNDYLSGKSTKDISALNLKSADAPKVTMDMDVLSALIGKNAPSFSDITGQAHLKDVLNAGTASAQAGRDKVIDASADLAKSALSYVSELKFRKEENENLKKDNEKLKDENKKFKEDNAKLKEDNEKLKQAQGGESK
ncbi:TPA: DUF4332 domain-containing protein [Neisseria weaveri]